MVRKERGGIVGDEEDEEGGVGDGQKERGGIVGDEGDDEEGKMGIPLKG